MAPLVVPIDIVGGHIFVNARLNGGTPLRFAIDTGAGDVLASDDADALGLRGGHPYRVYGTGERPQTARTVHVDAVDVGGAVLRDQHFTVLSFTDLRAAEGIQHFDGLIGHELFDRYIVRIDYTARTLTLFDPGDATPFQGSGAELQLAFYGTMPEVNGDVDGVSGPFTLDTGDRGSVSLLVPFVQKNELQQRYHPSAEGIAGWGIGGPVRAKLTRAAHVHIGTFDIAEPVTRIPQSRHGFFAGGSVAANIGYGVLHRFTLTFDYGHRRLRLLPDADYASPDVYDRSGMWLIDKGEGFAVADVIGGGPAAAAGLRPGDVIRSIDGRPASEIGLAAERDAFVREPLGTRVTLHIERSGAPLDVVLTLRDVV